MIIRCAWCGKILGRKEPLNDPVYTDGICDACMKKYFPSLERKGRSYRVEATKKGRVVSMFYE